MFSEKLPEQKICIACRQLRLIEQDFTVGWKLIETFKRTMTALGAE